MITNNRRLSPIAPVVLRKCLAEPVQVAEIVLLAKETRFTIVAALHGVQRESVNVNAWAERHDGKITKKASAKIEINRAWPLPFALRHRRFRYAEGEAFFAMSTVVKILRACLKTG
ncbi:hypothetical protein [Noviherbaspirillum agri]